MQRAGALRLAQQKYEKRVVDLDEITAAHGALTNEKPAQKLVEEGRDYTEALIQIAAVKSVVNNVGKLILQDHIQHCVVDAIESGDPQSLNNLSAAIDQFVK